MRQLLTVSDIATRLQVHRATVYKSVICRPDFPQPVRVAKHPRWFPEDVERWLHLQRPAEPQSQ